MGKKLLSRDDRLALALKRGYELNSTRDRQERLRKAEAPLYTTATLQKYEAAGRLWHE
jgi:hypothetical protein